MAPPESPTPPISAADDQRFAAGNAFARALKGEGADKPLHPFWRALITLVVAPLLMGAFLLPPLFTYGMLVDGVRGRHYGMLATGLLLAAMYLMIFVGIVKKRRAAKS